MGRLADPASLRQGEIHVWTAQLLDDDDVAAEFIDALEFDLGPAGGVRLVSLDGDRSAGDQWSVVRLDCPRGYAAAMATCHGFRELAHFAWKAGLPPRLGQQPPRRDIVMRSMADIRRPGL